MDLHIPNHFKQSTKTQERISGHVFVQFNRTYLSVGPEQLVLTIVLKTRKTTLCTLDKTFEILQHF